MGIIQASIPLFFALIALELLVAWRRRDRVYRFADTVADLACGTLSQVAGIFTKLGLLAAYWWVFAHARVQRWLPLPEWATGAPWADGAVQWPALGAWTAAMVLVDFAYYWMHRMSHEVNLLWAGHVVHHSSEEYNLAVALRQSALHGLFSWVFYVPLALVGLPFSLFAASYALNLVYQFWIHTREVDRLPRAAEAVLNTPSHHRVHHGVNPRYQDRNYAGILIVWDRWFGTFVEEAEAPVYGLTTPLRSWNPVWANVHVYWTILRGAWRAPTWAERRRILFGRPSEQAGAAEGLAAVRTATPETFRRFDPPAAAPVKWYTAVHFVLVIVVALRLLQASSRLDVAANATAVFYIAVSLANVGALLEGQAWAYRAEQARLVALGAAGAALALGGGASVTGLGLVAGSVASLAALRAVRPHLSAPAQVAPALLM